MQDQSASDPSALRCDTCAKVSMLAVCQHSYSQSDPGTDKALCDAPLFAPMYATLSQQLGKEQVGCHITILERNKK